MNALLHFLHHLYRRILCANTVINSLSTYHDSSLNLAKYHLVTHLASTVWN